MKVLIEIPKFEGKTNTATFYAEGTSADIKG